MLNQEFMDKIKSAAADVEFDADMKKHTTFKIGGNADCLVDVTSIQEISSVINLCKQYEVPFMVIGNGSNLLVKDGGIRGVVIKTSNMNNCQVQGESIYAECGVSLAKLATLAMTKSLSGIEFAGGIPGTVGGGIYMNAGAYGSEIADIIETVTYMDHEGNMQTISGGELEAGYRKSMFTDKNYIILSCVLKLHTADHDEIIAKMREYSKKRMEKQPLTQPSAGSTFKRPEGNFAGKLIEDAGLKGFSIGGAQVSTKHGGFVINTGCATAKDVIDVIDHVREKVDKEFGVKLEPEVRIIGDVENDDNK